MIHVTLVNPTSRRFFLARWNDPVTGLVKTKSTGETVKREAERFAARLEDQLNAGQFKRPVATMWDELRERFEREVSAGKAEKTRLKTQSMFNAIEAHFNPKLLSAVAEPSLISRYSTKLRELGLSAFTIHGHLAELRKVLRWAVKMELISKMPHIEFPTRTDGMKGRPITEEEFERIVDKIPTAKAIERKITPRDPSRALSKRNQPRRHADATLILPEHIDSWIHFLRGLWLSSLRLEESMKLHWTSDRELGVDFSHRRPMFRIQAASEKGRKFRLLPMAPEFADLLQQTPISQRKGFVFNPLTKMPSSRNGAHRPTANHAGRVISALGEAAGVKVSETKFASAHDFRRSFGYRWSKLVMPKVLQELMRHESIQTTMEFYVGDLALDAADEVWKAAQRNSNTSGNTSPETGSRNL